MGEERDVLLAKVVAHYAAHGVRDTSLRTLAASIGTSQRMLHYHFGSRTDVISAVIGAIAGQQAEHIKTLFSEEVDPFVAGHRNWEATVDGALTYGALWFELATHAMRSEPYAAELGHVMVDAQVREFTRIYALHTSLPQAQRLARLTLAVGQGLIFDLLIDRDRDAADAAIQEFTTMIRHELSDAPDRMTPNTADPARGAPVERQVSTQEPSTHHDRVRADSQSGRGRVPAPHPGHQ